MLIAQGLTKSAKLFEVILLPKVYLVQPEALNSAGEVTVKLSTDQWVVARCAGARTILVLMMQKNLNLMEVAEEVAKLDKSCFENICMI